MNIHLRKYERNVINENILLSYNSILIKYSSRYISLVRNEKRNEIHSLMENVIFLYFGSIGLVLKKIRLPGKIRKPIKTVPTPYRVHPYI